MTPPGHGYERRISIPDGMAVSDPFDKKRLDGGLYAAHMILFGAWDEGWPSLHRWVSESSRFDFRWETVEGVCGWLEEHLNYWNWDSSLNRQLDLLLPVRECAR